MNWGAFGVPILFDPLVPFAKPFAKGFAKPFATPFAKGVIWFSKVPFVGI